MSVAITNEPAAIDLLPDRRRLGLRLALIGAMLVGLAVAIASLPGLGEVRGRLADASPGWLAVALVAQVGSCLAFVVAFRGVYCRRMPWRLSYDVGMAAQGTNALLPAGGASGLALAGWALTRTGMPVAHVARRTVALYVLTSAVNFFTAVLAGGLLALGILSGGDSLALTAGPAALAVLSIAAALSLPRVLRGGRERRPDGRLTHLIASGSAALGGGISDARELVRSRNPLAIGGAVGYMTLDVATLGAAFAAIGDVPPIGVLMLAYVLGQLGGLIPLPGGVGGADGGLIAALVLYGTPLGIAAAAVLAYRAFQFGLPALLGALAMIRLPGVLRRAPDIGSPFEPLP
ncbi:MAG: flippase-like domain-containing protein, partial [Actinomycetota bacterium]|nr:flippase-like domain-containing protein [Actinomycetota bacterium]